MKSLYFLGLLAILTALLAPQADAQYQVTRVCIGSGGRGCLGPADSLNATLSQPVVGRMTGSGFQCSLGFWSQEMWTRIAVEEPPQPGTHSLRLARNVPNPVRDRTEIRFEVPASGPVELLLFDIQGRLVMTVVDETLPAGSHTRTVSLEGFAPGVYFYRLAQGAEHRCGRLVLLE